MAWRNPTTLAVIPARAGSKGVPGKNTAMVGGQPLIAHSIAVAKEARGIERVVVSTDCERIAAVARKYGAECPFLRPAEFATDDAPGRAVWKHVLEWLDLNEGYRPERTILMQATSPFRSVGDVESSLEILARTNADWVVSVTRTARPSPWLAKIEHDGRLAGFDGIEVERTQRQHLRDAYLPNGAVFLAKTEVLMNSLALYTERTFAYVMPQERSLDIDTPWDLYLADLVMKDRTDGRFA